MHKTSIYLNFFYIIYFCFVFKFQTTIQPQLWFYFCFIRFKYEHIFRFQLFEQDIGPLKRSLSAKTRRFSRISEIALVTKCFWAITCCFNLKKILKVSLHLSLCFVYIICVSVVFFSFLALKLKI